MFEKREQHSQVRDKADECTSGSTLCRIITNALFDVARSNPLQGDAFASKIVEKALRELQSILNCIRTQTAYGSEIICKFFEYFGRGIYWLRFDFEAVHKTEPIGDRVCK